MKIYVLTAGEYSDYHICGVTDNEEEAKKLKVRIDKEKIAWGCDDCNIEVYDTEDVQIVNKSSIYQVFLRTGKASQVEAEFMTAYLAQCDIYDRAIDVMYVLSSSPEKAFKKACDIRAKTMAEKAGI